MSAKWFHDRLAEEWYKRAQLALEKGDESLAREALSRRQSQVDIVDTITGQMNTQGQALDQLRGGMQVWHAMKVTLFVACLSHVHNMLHSQSSLFMLGVMPLRF